ncbi:MAG: class I SAM-dependent methyltransferase [Candidatus Micrarchaeia archaeon]
MTDSSAKRKTWETLAEIDPKWAILSDPEKIGNKWDDKNFYATGIEQIEKLFNFIEGKGITINEGIALDYGCGLGRLTEALANKFLKVYGVDFSTKMIEGAIKNPMKSPNTEYLQCDGKDLSQFENDKFDFVISLLTLQHNENKTQLNLINEFIRVTKKNGIIVFNVMVDLSILYSFEHIIYRVSSKFANKILDTLSRLGYIGPGYFKQNLSVQVFNVNRSKLEKILKEKGVSFEVYNENSHEFLYILKK